eukprot:1154444-Pelagomonas_calceolata.AAC.7
MNEHPGARPVLLRNEELISTSRVHPKSAPQLTSRMEKNCCSFCTLFHLGSWYTIPEVVRAAPEPVWFAGGAVAAAGAVAAGAAAAAATAGPLLLHWRCCWGGERTKMGVEALTGCLGRVKEGQLRC